ncbi:MAG: hypothetical protein A2W91_08660 [Bacteroidetes bacterium GWF2_38_335]|nr:MAG: hypothetical protein A2W91_08660 [Bacteroidetes bacterium GWF2_38_335]OFY80446.1 MAG: hypothetical protein A2281_08385 [Bacteroidetes bacterium RIFOXYA12_FULL_38_20]HBS85949.1 hypothetical protein [Bacteroidales bacterium]
MIGSGFSLKAHQPWRTWATYYGSEFTTTYNYLWMETSAVAYGDNNEVYTGGTTQSAGTGLNGMVMRFNSSGQMVWQTNISGSASDKVVDIFYWSSFVYAVGWTSSFDLPGALGTYQGNSDAFVAKLDATTGAIIWIRYYGGPGDDRPAAISKRTGTVAIVGSTSSTTGIHYGTGFQSTYGGGPTDGFIACIDYYGTVTWGTYYGGTQWDAINDITGGLYNEYYITGVTNSTTGISTFTGNTYQGGGADVILAKLNSSNGTRTWGKYYGGAGHDEALGAFSLGSGVYICGKTKSTSGIAEPGGYRTTKSSGTNFDAFVSCFDASGGICVGTYFGDQTTGTDIAMDVVWNSTSEIVISGKTNSTSNIATTGSWQTTLGGDYDGFVAKFNNSLSSLSWGTYYGGSAYDECEGLAVNGNTFYTVGYTYSQGLPTHVAYDKNLTAGLSSSFLAKFIDRDCNVSVSVTNYRDKLTGGCRYTATPSGGSSPYSYLWTTGQTTQSVLVYSGTPHVMVTDALGCTGYPWAYPIPCLSSLLDVEENAVDAISIYPNPVNDILTIETDGANDGYVTIIDLTGKEVLNYQLNQGETSSKINVSELNNGVYFLKLNSGFEMKTFKVVVSH